MSENAEGVHAIYYKNNIVGLAYISGDVWGYLYIYIFSQNRQKGYGKVAVRISEQQMFSPNLRNITTCYSGNNKVACEFAKACGYIKEFASAYMKFFGSAFEETILPIRQYRDEDYKEAQALTAKAFHKMRLDTGCFPNSVPETPSAEMRKLWKDTADERYVYVLENEIVGYAHIDGAELAEVSIKISQQGKGLGTGFVKFLINILLKKGYKEPFLYCVVGNKARNLYELLGFKKVACSEYAKKRVEENQVLR